MRETYQITIKFFANNMTINFYMFGAVMKYSVFRNSYTSSIIHMQWSWSSLCKAHRISEHVEDIARYPASVEDFDMSLFLAFP